ncbi:MAG: hypothetical protein NC453_29120, partial [Muribaculum sp.]|nr:hypothetical protein [Muribaculum sp.]
MEDRAGGDEIRLITFKQVYDKINVISIILGHGLGYGVEIRPVHMENSYLEIFHKLGLVGMLFWIYLFYWIHKLWQSTKIIKTCTILYIGVVMLYVQSMFNPYINNPIGLGYLMIAYAVIRYYAYRLNNLSIDTKKYEPSYNNSRI